jgi:hypothetical protein
LQQRITETKNTARARPDALTGWLIYHLGDYWAGLKFSAANFASASLSLA